MNESAGGSLRPFVLAYHDDPALCDLLVEALTPVCLLFHTHPLSETRHALDLVRPELLLLGIGKGGSAKIRFIEDIKADPSLASIPIMVTTTRAKLPTVILRSVAAVLYEPFPLDCLQEGVKQLVALSERGPRAPARRAADPAGENAIGKRGKAVHRTAKRRKK